MGVIDWVRKIFASYECPASAKKRHRSDEEEEEEEEIEELIAIDII